MGFADTLAETVRQTEARILVIDIETVPMKLVGFGLRKQNFSLDHIVEPGRTVCFAAQWYGEKKVRFHSEFHDGRQEMVERAWELLDECDILVGYNHRRFDVPHLQRCFVEEGMPAPRPWQDVDLLSTVRRQFKFDSAKLGWVAQQLGLGTKVPHDGIVLWRQVMENDPKAWAQFRRYCKADVALTTELYAKLRPYIDNHPNVNMYRDARVSGCVTCGSADLVDADFYRTQTRSYAMFRCLSCGSLSRATHSDPTRTHHRRAT